MEKILDKAASNPTWKQRLLDDPEAAMQEANFPETQQLEELRQEQGEVMGHSAPAVNYGKCINQCWGPQWHATYLTF